MKMEKNHLNDKVLDKEKALSAIKTSYLNSYKVIVAGARDFADYAYMKKKQKTSVNNCKHPTPIAIQLHPQCLLGIQSILRNWTFLIFKQV